MSRTSKTLLRLGVPTLAAATMLGGIPAFLGTANAAHIAGVTLTPDTSDATAGTCVPFTARIAFTAGQTPVNETIDVQIDEIDFDANTTGNQSSATADADFCTAPTTSSNGTSTTTTTPATQEAGGADSGAAGTSDRAEFVATVDADDNVASTPRTASVTFGVVVNEPGTVNVRAFYEVDGSANENNAFDANEFSDNSVATFRASGANEVADVEVLSQTDAFAPNAVPTANDDVDTALEAETRTFRVRVASTGGRTLAGVPVTFTTNQNPGDEGDRGPTFFATTDNSGIATGTITFPVRDETVATTDRVTFFVNQTDLVTTSPNVDAGEDSDIVDVRVQDNAGQQNRSVDLIALTDADNGFNSINGDDNAVNSVRDGDRTFRALVDDPRAAGSANTTTGGTLLAFAVNGGSGDETITVTNPTNGGQSNECTTTAFADDDARDTNNSACEVTVNDPTPRVGQSLTVTATVRGTSATDSGTVFFRNEPQDARNIVLTPEAATVTTNTAQTLTARVIDADGNGVAGVTVNFAESGPGAFRNGQSTNSAVTDSSGNAVTEVISLPGETGTQTVTATITNQGNQTTQAAGAGFDAEGNRVPSTQTAGNNTDSSTINYVNTLPSPSASPSASPTASATPTASASPSAPNQGASRLGISVSPATITPGVQSVVRITGTPGSIIELQAYSRPSTEYVVVRRGTIGESGVIEFRVTPGTNTRLFAAVTGVANTESPSVVINVRTALSLTVVRNGRRDYTFQGRILPRRAGQLITLYRVTNTGQEILTAQLRTDSSGTYRIRRVFTGSGTFGFLTRTGQTLTNAAGVSNNGQARPTAIF